ncbi:MAG: aspartate ammonia-lyase, partial [Deinococcus sp.]|nr:aspartate ammonia-lyase [Deinococcus sp.]
MTNWRVERDTLGEVPVPADAYYGAQTARAVENFPISGLRAHPAFIRAYARLKRAAAQVNQELGQLDSARAGAIIRAADEVLSGQLAEQFVVDVYQAG